MLTQCVSVPVPVRQCPCTQCGSVPVPSAAVRLYTQSGSAHPVRQRPSPSTEAALKRAEAALTRAEAAIMTVIDERVVTVRRVALQSLF